MPKDTETPGGWEKPEGCAQYHYFSIANAGVSLCKHWMGYWPNPSHDINHPENCPECVKFARAGNTKLTNPFGP
jgi:hypothetical protein